ncbi:MAG: ABC transporter permease [Defluviitaleaceae bacterium]|nr:ABC transporter permease [Defluviitaleaceae bacterium]
MSKYNVWLKTANKLEESIIDDFRARVTASPDDLTEENAAKLPAEYFQFAHNEFKEAERAGYSNYSYWGSTIRMFFRNKMGVVTFAILVVLMGFAFIQPILPGQLDPGTIHDDLTAVPVRFYRNVPPQFFEGRFFLGTNAIGQDLWARMWAGTRNSLFIGFTVAGISMAFGIMFGMLWGYVRKLDFLFTEMYNIINNIPNTIILILAAMLFGPSIPVLVAAMSMWAWIGHAHNIRNLTLMFRDREFNLASRCLGTGVFRVIIRNLLPQMISVIMLRMALAVPIAITGEVFLSYLGLGISQVTPTLGNLLEMARPLMRAHPYQLLFPAAILSVISICFYLAGNAFSDSADPRNHV